MRYGGTIKTWNDERGFGFIAPTRGGEEVFFHVKAFRGYGARPVVGQPVMFEPELDPEGRKRANEVDPLRQPPPAVPRGQGGSAGRRLASYLAIVAFLLIYLVVAALWRVPIWVAGLYGGASLLAFLIYAVDKSAAAADSWRVKESTLLAVGLVGGWPGAIVAQQTLRHKSSKQSFLDAFWTTVALNVVAFVAIASPLGQQLL